MEQKDFDSHFLTHREDKVWQTDLSHLFIYYLGVKWIN